MQFLILGCWWGGVTTGSTRPPISQKQRKEIGTIAALNAKIGA